MPKKSHKNNGKNTKQSNCQMLKDMIEIRKFEKQFNELNSVELLDLLLTSAKYNHDQRLKNNNKSRNNFNGKQRLTLNFEHQQRLALQSLPVFDDNDSIESTESSELDDETFRLNQEEIIDDLIFSLYECFMKITLD